MILVAVGAPIAFCVGQSTGLPPGLDPPLVKAARLGQYELVEQLVTNNADINAHGMGGDTALHVAANRSDVWMVEFLLKHQADPNARDKSGLTPLVQAIHSAEVTQLLLDYGADVNAHDADNTAFSVAVENGDQTGAGVINLLLAHGADVALAGDTALNSAALSPRDDTNLVSMLVPYYVKSSNPAALPILRGALERAIDNDRSHMALAILSECTRLQNNPLQKAVVLGDSAAVRAILATNPASVNRRDFFGWAPLHLAALSGDALVAGILLSNQADVNLQDDLSNTPLHWAAYCEHRSLVELLLRHNASMDGVGNSEPNRVGYRGDTALDLAIRRGFTSIAALLITNGASLGPHNSYGRTPLHIATRKENVELMKLLLARGANVNAYRLYNRGADRESPLDIAVRGNSPEAVRLLISNGANLQTRMRASGGVTNTLFHLWALRGNTNIADQLLAAGCDVNARNGRGETPLHIAVVHWNTDYRDAHAPWAGRAGMPRLVAEDSGQDTTRWLLNHKADVNAKDDSGQTPLHLAASQGNIEAIACLLEQKADVNTTDNKGQNPLAVLEMLKLLQASGRGPRGIDLKPAEDLLLAHGAKGPLLSPRPLRRHF